MDGLTVFVFLIFACFFEGVAGAIRCFGIIEFWIKFAPETYQKDKNIGPKLPQGRPKSVQRGTPKKFRKTGRKQNAPPDERAKQIFPKSEPKSDSLACLG